MTAAVSLSTVLSELRGKGKENTRAIYARHGLPLERTFGTGNADMKLIAKQLKGRQALALELFATGMVEAMYLAGLVADGAKMTEQELQAWAEGAAGLSMIAEHTVPWVTVEHSMSRQMALRWIGSEKKGLAPSGWCTYSGLATVLPDTQLDLDEMEGLLEQIVARIHSAENRAKYTMNGFLIAVGSYVLPLAEKAKAAVAAIGPVVVATGETACQVPDALTYIQKAEATGKAGKKRKTIRC